jgi:hypothetical protein
MVRSRGSRGHKLLRSIHVSCALHKTLPPCVFTILEPRVRRLDMFNLDRGPTFAHRATVGRPIMQSVDQRPLTYSYHSTYRLLRVVLD